MQVAIKKVLQDKRFKNRELQIMKMMSHPNVVGLKHCFYSTTEKEEVRHGRSALLLHAAMPALCRGSITTDRAYWLLEGVPVVS